MNTNKSFKSIFQLIRYSQNKASTLFLKSVLLTFINKTKPNHSQTSDD